jgi:hypothetical protein
MVWRGIRWLDDLNQAGSYDRIQLACVDAPTDIKLLEGFDSEIFP